MTPRTSHIQPPWAPLPACLDQPVTTAWQRPLRPAVVDGTD